MACSISIRIIIHGTKLDSPVMFFPIQNYLSNFCLSWHIRFVLTAKDNSCLEQLKVQQGNQCHAMNPIFACENLKTYRMIKIRLLYMRKGLSSKCYNSICLLATKT